MKKVTLGVLLGALIGVIDIIPMIAHKITWDANLSAFFYWVVVGFFIATTDIKIKGSIKGLFISTEYPAFSI